MNGALLSYLKESGKAIEAYFAERPALPLTPAELQEGTFVYFKRGGKRLRPAICRLAAGALGGKAAEEAAVPCALALELYHNWTLVHDDIIDHDDTRRGKKAVHAMTAEAFASSLSPERAAEYGEDVAILAGDALHSAAVYYLSLLSEGGSVPPAVTLRILSLLEGDYGLRLISGETVDTKWGFLYGKGSFTDLTEEEILGMMAGKTGALFGISALSGALIGSGKTEPGEKELALRDFAEACGIAFQLQDDILGLVADEAKLGKPVLSDLREGKGTLLLLHAYEQADPAQKAFLSRVVGGDGTEEELLRARDLILALGGKTYTEKKAGEYLEKARLSLEKIPPSPYRDLLEAWRLFMLDREM